MSAEDRGTHGSVVSSLSREVVKIVNGIRHGRRGRLVNVRLERTIADLADMPCKSLDDVAAKLEATDRYIDLRWDGDRDCPERKLLRSMVEFFRDGGGLVPAITLLCLLPSASRFFADVGLLKSVFSVL